MKNIFLASLLLAMITFAGNTMVVAETLPGQAATAAGAPATEQTKQESAKHQKSHHKEHHKAPKHEKSSKHKKMWKHKHSETSSTGEKKDGTM